MQTNLYNKSGNIIGSLNLPDRVFNRAWSSDLVHQVLVAQLANKRNTIAHTKTRGEVSGGGKKPWAQKHTGRSRHGSIRSPIWKGGGVVFGPTKEKKFSQKVNKKMKQAAIFAVLSKRVSEGVLKIIDNISIDTPKTKIFKEEFKNFLKDNNSTLFIPRKEAKNVFQANLNLSGTKTLSPESLNIYDLLKHKQILMDKEAVNLIDAHYKKLKPKKI